MERRPPASSPGGGRHSGPQGRGGRDPNRQTPTAGMALFSARTSGAKTVHDSGPPPGELATGLWPASRGSAKPASVTPGPANVSAASPFSCGRGERADPIMRVSPGGGRQPAARGRNRVPPTDPKRAGPEHRSEHGDQPRKRGDPDPRRNPCRLFSGLQLSCEEVALDSVRTALRRLKDRRPLASPDRPWFVDIADEPAIETPGCGSWAWAPRHEAEDPVGGLGQGVPLANCSSRSHTSGPWRERGRFRCDLTEARRVQGPAAGGAPDRGTRCAWINVSTRVMRLERSPISLCISVRRLPISACTPPICFCMSRS